jgi:FtsP/CotA-like multicopper oxidase with cupredoxin domain
MRAISRLLPVVFLGLAFAGSSRAQDAKMPCPMRPLAGTPLKEEPSISSVNGILTVHLTLKTEVDAQNFRHYCLNDHNDGLGFVESPTLRLNPGDKLDMDLTDDLPAGLRSNYADEPMADGMDSVRLPAGSCTTGKMEPAATNMHFHGLNVPPTCHQDDILTTLLNPGDPPFHFHITIPKNDQPGLYWYHPHPHGFTTNQVNGGAAGAIVIEGIEKLRPEVAGLKERVLILRQQFPVSPTWVPGPFQLTLNYQPAITPGAPAPIITMKLGSKEFWRFANASTQAFLNLQVSYAEVPQMLEVIAIDGIPLDKPVFEETIPLPPAGRVEFIVAAPTAGQTAMFYDAGTATGAVGNFNGFQELARIETSSTGDNDLRVMPAVHGSAGPQRFADLINQPVTTNRKLYFSEAPVGTNGPTKYYITEVGKTPRVFSSGEPPAIKTTIGAVEDWVLENRAQEDHAFHIHQIHFLLLERDGKPVKDPYLADTVILPFWKGSGPYPSVKMRMDFREPQIAGTFVYHCHVLQHEDAGMMAQIEVDPK